MKLAAMVCHLSSIWIGLGLFHTTGLVEQFCTEKNSIYYSNHGVWNKIRIFYFVLLKVCYKSTVRHDCYYSEESIYVIIFICHKCFVMQICVDFDTVAILSK